MHSILLREHGQDTSNLGEKKEGFPGNVLSQLNFKEEIGVNQVKKKREGRAFQAKGTAKAKLGQDQGEKTV